MINDTQAIFIFQNEMKKKMENLLKLENFNINFNDSDKEEIISYIEIDFKKELAKKKKEMIYFLKERSNEFLEGIDDDLFVKLHMDIKGKYAAKEILFVKKFFKKLYKKLEQKI